MKIQAINPYTFSARKISKPKIKQETKSIQQQEKEAQKIRLRALGYQHYFNNALKEAQEIIAKGEKRNYRGFFDEKSGTYTDFKKHSSSAINYISIEQKDENENILRTISYNNDFLKIYEYDKQKETCTIAKFYQSLFEEEISLKTVEVKNNNKTDVYNFHSNIKPIEDFTFIRAISTRDEEAYRISLTKKDNIVIHYQKAHS